MIGIICAMQLEADGIIGLCEDVRTYEIAKMKFTRGVMHGTELVTAVCGVGKVNAAMCCFAMIERFKPDAVINSGVAGSVSPLVSIGDIVIADKSVEHDMNTTALGDKQGEVSFGDGKEMFFECDSALVKKLEEACEALDGVKVEKGVVASGDIFVSDRGSRRKLNERFGALACEMEGAAIGHVCRCCSVPYAIIRAISDDLDENKGCDFEKFCRSASERTVEVIDRLFKES